MLFEKENQLIKYLCQNEIIFTQACADVEIDEYQVGSQITFLINDKK